jgi:hypothetical protein
MNLNLTSFRVAIRTLAARLNAAVRTRCFATHENSPAIAELFLQLFGARA